MTQNGYGDMVIMSMDIFESTIKQMNILRELEIFENLMREGRTNVARSSLTSL